MAGIPRALDTDFAARLPYILGDVNARAARRAARKTNQDRLMARTDAIVLGAGIVGTAVALHLAKRGLAVALVDRRGPGEETSYGNTGIIEGNTIFPPAFPRGLAALARIAFKRAPEANYHLAFLPKVAPWLLAYRAWSQPERLA
jgi:D-amino-acid dehydrogenase